MAKDTDQEPSIEEILTSIRQIISDDDDEETTAQAPYKKEPESDYAPEPEPEDDIIELTEMADPVEEAPPEPVFTPEPDPVEEPEDEPESEDENTSFPDEPESVMEIDMQDADLEEEPDLDPEDTFSGALNEDVYDAVEQPAAQDFDHNEQEDESILTKKAEDAAYNGFKRLAVKTAVDTISGVTIEEIVRDELRPMLRVWLDDNLPQIVERLVKDELDKVARRALED